MIVLMNSLQSELAKQSATKPQAKVLVPKLYDANQAGGPKSSECTLILTEGDSAKALAIAGISSSFNC
jgi:DNA topoisomerase-2